MKMHLKMGEFLLYMEAELKFCKQAVFSKTYSLGIASTYNDHKHIIISISIIYKFFSFLFF